MLCKVAKFPCLQNVKLWEVKWLIILPHITSSPSSALPDPDTATLSVHLGTMTTVKTLLKKKETKTARNESAFKIKDCDKRFWLWQIVTKHFVTRQNTLPLVLNFNQIACVKHTQECFSTGYTLEESNQSTGILPECIVHFCGKIKRKMQYLTCIICMYMYDKWLIHNTFIYTQLRYNLIVVLVITILCYILKVSVFGNSVVSIVAPDSSLVSSSRALSLSTSSQSVWRLQRTLHSGVLFVGLSIFKLPSTVSSVLKINSECTRITFFVLPTCLAKSLYINCMWKSVSECIELP